jgi:hypothetical protein
MKGYHDVLRDNSFSVFMLLGISLHLSRFPSSGYLRETIEAMFSCIRMIQVSFVFQHGQLLRLIQSCVTMVFIYLGLVGRIGLSNVHLPSLRGDAVFARCFQSQVVFHGAEEVGDFSRWKIYRFDAMRR